MGIAGEALQHRHFFLKGGITHGDPDEETVHLGLGQGIGAHELRGVLGGQHHKGLGQGMGHAVHRDLIFLHDLQKGALCLGGSTVDFVGQRDLTHDGPGMILHLPGLEVHHGEARHIGGHHVRRKLDAVEAAIQRLGQRADHGGLAGAGHVLQKHVTLAHQRDQ